MNFKPNPVHGISQSQEGSTRNKSKVSHEQCLSPEPSFLPVPHLEANLNTKSSHCEIWIYEHLEKDRVHSFVLPWTLILI